MVRWKGINHLQEKHKVLTHNSTGFFDRHIEESVLNKGTNYRPINSHREDVLNHLINIECDRGLFVSILIELAISIFTRLSQHRYILHFATPSAQQQPKSYHRRHRILNIRTAANQLGQRTNL